MSVYRIVWEDEAKAREIELFVDYSLSEGNVQVEAIRPEKVTFYSVDTKQQLRSIGIHTKTGRRMLTEQYMASRDGISLEEEIRNQLDERDQALAAEVAG
jgi:hypothetical protein